MKYWGRDRDYLKWRCPVACGEKVQCTVRGGCSGSKYGRVLKISMWEDPRRWPGLARESKKWKRLYKHRTAVERVNARLKDYLQLDELTVRGLAKVKVHTGAGVAGDAGGGSGSGAEGAGGGGAQDGTPGGVRRPPEEAKDARPRRECAWSITIGRKAAQERAKKGLGEVSRPEEGARENRPAAPHRQIPSASGAIARGSPFPLVLTLPELGGAGP